ncbi:hypothetical protein QQ045_022914 [Rhodiola kirilowii]
MSACTNEKYAPLVKKVDQVDEEPNQNADKAIAEHTSMRKNLSEITDMDILQPSPDSLDPVRPQPVLYQLLPDQPVSIPIIPDHLASSYISAPGEPRSSSEMISPSRPPNTSSFVNTEDGYRSYLQFSSAFSNMAVSNLQQNPVAHATANVAAATFVPNPNMEAPAKYYGGFPSRVGGTGRASPDIAAVTAATVAAAAAWWASIGLIPFCAQQQSHTHNWSCATTNNDVASNAAAMTVVNEKSHQDPTDKQNQGAEMVDCPMHPRRSSAFKPLISVPAKPEESMTTMVISNKKSAGMGAEIEDSNSPVEDRRKLVRSSSGSNTTSGTELESNILEKQDRGNDDSNAADDVHSIGDSSNRRSKIAANINDSWKEVSEEGRVAFRALFSREVLPQKFSSLYSLSNLETLTNIGQDSELKLGGLAFPIDRNLNIYGYNCITDQLVKTRATERAEIEGAEGLHSIGLGKLRTRRTGFKPYKRCSIEAKDISGCSQGKEKRPRSTCLDGGEVST